MMNCLSKSINQQKKRILNHDYMESILLEVVENKNVLGKKEFIGLKVLSLTRPGDRTHVCAYIM
jgi:hypothetical protein